MSGKDTLPHRKRIEIDYFHYSLSKIILYAQTHLLFYFYFCISIFLALQDVIGTHCWHCRMLLTPINNWSIHSFDIVCSNIFYYYYAYANAIIVLFFYASRSSLRALLETPAEGFAVCFTITHYNMHLILQKILIKPRFILSYPPLEECD